ncbi:hypothetical protein ABT301_12945 [Streptomyces sp. NPDC000987]|uniref:hypothetical protein n=1 Tax=Streptomyces sp. NPDC000987 TaxID=3154374 RepID=UPI00332BDC8A
MSAHLLWMCRAVPSRPASTAGKILRADSGHEPDRYVQPAEDGGIIPFLASAQSILTLVALLTAAILLVWQLWPDRGKDGPKDEEPGKPS